MTTSGRPVIAPETKHGGAQCCGRIAARQQKLLAHTLPFRTKRRKSSMS
jgi:hypothetical protein